MASHTEITLLTMQSQTESGKSLGPMMISNHSKETQVKVVWACIKIIRASGQCKEGEKGANKRSVGRTTSLNGQG